MASSPGLRRRERSVRDIDRDEMCTNAGWGGERIDDHRNGYVVIGEIDVSNRLDSRYIEKTLRYVEASLTLTRHNCFADAG